MKSLINLTDISTGKEITFPLAYRSTERERKGGGGRKG